MKECFQGRFNYMNKVLPRAYETVHIVCSQFCLTMYEKGERNIADGERNWYKDGFLPITLLQQQGKSFYFLYT